VIHFLQDALNILLRHSSARAVTMLRRAPLLRQLLAIWRA
jgi:hypothetical protein